MRLALYYPYYKTIPICHTMQVSDFILNIMFLVMIDSMLGIVYHDVEGIPWYIRKSQRKEMWSFSIVE